MVLGYLVKLRPMEPSDADAIWRWHQDPDVLRWMTDGYEQSLAQVRKRFDERPRNSYSDVLFGIEALLDGRLIGLVRLDGAEPETSCAVVATLPPSAVDGTNLVLPNGRSATGN